MKFLFIDESSEGDTFAMSGVILNENELDIVDKIFNDTLNRFGFDEKLEVHVKNLTHNIHKEDKERIRGLLEEIIKSVCINTQISFVTAIVLSKHDMERKAALAYKFLLERAMGIINEKTIVVYDNSLFTKTIEQTHANLVG